MITSGGGIPVVDEQQRESFIAMEQSTMKSPTKTTQPKLPQSNSGSKERRKRSDRTPMEMIDNSLTVKIEEDMLTRANIVPPKEVRRLGTDAGFKPS